MSRLAVVALATALFVLGAVTVGAHQGAAVSTTSYCLNGRTADGTRLDRGAPTERMLRTAASNSLPLGTRIRITSRQAGPGGRRRYVIRDRIGHGTQLDLWARSCQQAIRYGRRAVTFKRGWSR